MAALWWLVVIAVAAASVATAPAASAHASVLASSPTDGSSLDAAPVALTFDLNEPVSLVDGSAQLIDVNGTRYPLATTALEDGRQRIVMKPAESVPDGSYLATARVVSADTHVVALSIRFTVGAVEPGQWAATGDGQAVVGPLVLYPVKVAVYVGLVLSSGLLLAVRWAWPDQGYSQRFRTVYRAGAGLLAVGLLGRLAVLVVEQAGGLFDASAAAVLAIVTTPFGIALVAAASLSLATVVFPPSRGRLAGWLGGAAAACAITAVTLGGHGGSTQLWPLPFVATFIHVYAVAVWLGGVGAIVLLWHSVPNLSRWHRVALGHVVVVVLAGATLGLLQVRPVEALVTTTYGLTLVVKILLVVGAVGAAYFAWRHYRSSAEKARTPTVVAEAALVLVVIALTSSLSSLTPAKDSYTTDVATRLDFGGDDVLDVDIDTVRRGSQVITVEHEVADSRGADVSVELSSAQANVARLPVELSEARRQDGTVVWTSAGLVVPSPGQWKVTVRYDDGTGSPRLASFTYRVL